MAVLAIRAFAGVLFMTGLLGLGAAEGAEPATANPPGAVPRIAVIPRPAETTTAPGEFRFGPRMRILYQESVPGLARTAQDLRDGMRAAVGVAPRIAATKAATPQPGAIMITSASADPALGDEGYSLTVSPESVVIRARAASGAFYGVQSLLQLLPLHAQGAAARTVPCLQITDKPRYAWRGMMLDCSRHFMKPAFIKRFLDLMAYHKLNVFHWHFIDSNGWRMQVDALPRLTEVGAWRGKGKSRYGGYYTKDEIRDIVAYAKERHITVVPEFEMPGHSDAAMAAYPDLSCSGTQYLFPDKPLEWDNLGYFTQLNHSRPFCAGNDAGFEFNARVFDEALALFDSPFYHVGGDERPKGVWENCPKCQARMKLAGLPDEHALQNWFMKKVSDMLAARGKRTISWAVTRSDPYSPTDMDDLGNNAIIQNWHNGAAFAARKGWDVVNAHNGFVYFDYPEYPDKTKPKWMPVLGLEKVYSFDPTPAGLSTTESKHILGGEACLWTEFVPQERVLPQVFPRMLALAEVVWSPKESRDFAEFRGRVEAVRPRLGAMGVKYGEPTETVKP